MSIWVLTRAPRPARLAVLLGAMLLAAACGGNTGGTSHAASGSAGSSMTGAITTRSGSSGPFLTDGSGRTVYLWVKDTVKNKSVCTGSCASFWPPVLVKGTPTASGGVKPGDLSTITRSDGGRQVAYDGHALYYYAGDSGPGQMNGQGSDGFGAKWWMVSPSGTQITGAEKVTAPASSGSGSGSGSKGSSSGGSSGYGNGY